ncbi:MAG: M48 family metallopeptidase [Gemmataceae bacterium]
MPLLLLVVLTLACWPQKWEQPWEWVGSPFVCIGLTWATIGLTVLAAKAISIWLRWRLAWHPDQRNHWIHRYRVARRVHYYALFPVFGLVLYLFGWGWAVQSFLPGGDETPPYLSSGGELLIIIPFLVSLLLSWACFYEAEQAVALSNLDQFFGFPWRGRWEYAAHQARQNLALVAAPVLLLVFQKGLIQVLWWLPFNLAWLASLAGVLTAIIVLITTPWILRLALGLQPFPNGPLRDRLLATARRLNFRFSNLLLWNTHGHVANAMVAGPLPFPRYVLLSDRLITDLTPDEVEAVFGHEIGHVKHRHLWLYLLFLGLSLVLLGALLLPSLNSWFHGRQDLQMAPFMGLIGAYIFVFFGFLSRRCERQADVYGCRAVSCGKPDCTAHDPGQPLPADAQVLCPTGIQTFIQALEKVADSNGMSRDRPGWLRSWQHSTIARRVNFLASVRTDQRIERRFQRRVLAVKWALFLGLIAGLAAVGLIQGWKALLYDETEAGAGQEQVSAGN